jgi:small-conductance mechanosensitive channel
LLRRFFQITIFTAGIAIVLQNAGFNLTALFAVLGLGGLALSLSAKETLEDIINGFIILVDRPYQIGDRVKVENMDTWGDVEDVGTRTTKIRTLDNRLVVIPNSIMGNSQVENYTVGDPSYRVDLSLGIAYGSDIDLVIEIVEGAIKNVEGIKKDPPPQVDFIDFGESAMVFQVFYWLESYRDLRLRTSVNKAIVLALDESNIEMPYTTYDINLAYQERFLDEGPELLD